MELSLISFSTLLTSLLELSTAAIFAILLSLRDLECRHLQVRGAASVSPARAKPCSLARGSVLPEPKADADFSYGSCATLGPPERRRYETMSECHNRIRRKLGSKPRNGWRFRPGAPHPRGAMSVLAIHMPTPSLTTYGARERAKIALRRVLSEFGQSPTADALAR